jgi:hypothetical protein
VLDEKFGSLQDFIATEHFASFSVFNCNQIKGHMQGIDGFLCSGKYASILTRELKCAGVRVDQFCNSSIAFRLGCGVRTEPTANPFTSLVIAQHVGIVFFAARLKR